MKAIGARNFLPVFNPNCLVEFDAAAPSPGPLDLLVRVRTFAVNPAETKIRASLSEMPADPPRILGWDAAGVVETIGAAVTGLLPGLKFFTLATSAAPVVTRNAHAWTPARWCLTSPRRLSDTLPLH